MIHTRDHGHPHVTVYFGTPEHYEAMAKVRLDVVLIIECEGFSEKAIRMILAITATNQQMFMEVWNEYHEE